MKKWQQISAGLLAVVTASIAVDALLLEKIFFKTKRFTLGSPSGKNFITLLHLTDLHFKNSISLKYLKLVRKIKQIRPDIILISGDSIDEEGEIEPFEAFLRMLDSSIPVVAIPGNHEYEADINMANYKKLFDKVGGDLLVNETQFYVLKGQRLAVTGVDDMLNSKGNFEAAVANVGNEKNHLVLIHSPEHHERVREKIKNINAKRKDEKKLNIFAFLAGHTHGGQVKLGPVVPILPPASGGYIEGWYHDEKPYLYLSKGFGTSTLPVRFFARAEITELTYFTDS